MKRSLLNSQGPQLHWVPIRDHQPPRIDLTRKVSTRDHVWVTGISVSAEIKATPEVHCEDQMEFLGRHVQISAQQSFCSGRGGRKIRS